MKLLLLLLVLVAQTAYAAKSCEELAREISAKLDDVGVKGYSLEIVPNALVAGGTVVGSCDGGSKKIIYARAKYVAPSPPKKP